MGKTIRIHLDNIRNEKALELIELEMEIYNGLEKGVRFTEFSSEQEYFR